MKVHISPEVSKRLREMQEVNEAIDKCWSAAFLESAKKMLDDMANPPPPRRPDQPIIEDLTREGDSIKFGVRYQLGHRYDETWVPCELYCINCGSKKVYERIGASDYYDGSEKICLDCGTSFCGNLYKSDDPEHLARVEAIREKSNFKLCPKCGTPMEMS